MEINEFLRNHALLVQIAIGVFWTLLFLQSGFDKFFDWKGNIAWLSEHFGKSSLKSFVKPMVAILAIVEIIAGLACLFGIFNLLMFGKSDWLLFGLIMSIVSLLMLFFGQRMAKDYEGARTIAVYFGVALLSYMALAA